jgi:predicted RNA binding protein YcfA (HicA-like mRNA interferase family)
MPKMVLITAKKLSSLLLDLGFVERDAEGSHVFFKHPDGRTTTVPMHTKELSRGLLRKILNDIEISRDEYEKLRGKL